MLPFHSPLWTALSSLFISAFIPMSLASPTKHAFDLALQSNYTSSVKEDCLSSLHPYAPHLIPTASKARADSPFFEGWYSRFFDTDSNHSVALIVGFVESVESRSNPYVHLNCDFIPFPYRMKIDRNYVGLVVQSPNGAQESFKFHPTALRILQRSLQQGSSAQGPLSFQKEPHFSILANNSDFEFNLTVTPHSQRVVLISSQLNFKANIHSRVPWTKSDNNSHPEGWFLNLPLPLHWYVYSMASQGSFTLISRKFDLHSTRSLIHMEKNWGQSFPTAWTWAQAFSKDGRYRLAFGGGPIPIPIPIPLPNGFSKPTAKAWLIGFKSPNVDVNFGPPLTLLGAVSESSDACNGRFSLTAEDANHILQIDIAAPKVCKFLMFNRPCAKTRLSPLFYPFLAPSQSASKTASALKVSSLPQKLKFIRKLGLDSGALWKRLCSLGQPWSLVGRMSVNQELQYEQS